MPQDLPGIVFFDEVEGFRAAHAQMVQVPAGVTDKRRLMGVYADALKLPDYFGFDWEALEECLRDRLEAEQQLLVVHKDLPLVGAADEQQAYVRLLQDLADGESPARFTAVFPEAVRAQVLELTAN
jgi:hypothetical protein